ncbi:MAG: nucleotide exchange factor GrpE [Prevotella sp.]|nr:nucleotide exchange factor GrpE [Prevotella sp.]
MKEEDIHIDDEEQKDDPVEEEETVATEEAQDEAEKDAEAEPAEERDPLDVALEEIESLKDKYLRQVAEFDNYRKRTLKERAELILNGGEKAIKAILPVVDDMERAMKNGANTDDPQVLRDGMELIYNKMMKTLEGLGVTKIETEDADFDTDLHDAEALVPGMGDDKKGKVIDCIATGYKLNDKVIRHAKVAVGQ